MSAVNGAVRVQPSAVARLLEAPRYEVIPVNGLEAKVAALPLGVIVTGATGGIGGARRPPTASAGSPTCRSPGPRGVRPASRPASSARAPSPAPSREGSVSYTHLTLPTNR